MLSSFLTPTLYAVTALWPVPSRGKRRSFKRRAGNPTPETPDSATGTNRRLNTTAYKRKGETQSTEEYLSFTMRPLFMTNLNENREVEALRSRIIYVTTNTKIATRSSKR